MFSAHRQVAIKDEVAAEPTCPDSIRSALVVSTIQKEVEMMNAEMFCKGQKFFSIALIKDAVFTFEVKNSCNLIIRDSNTLTNSSNKLNLDAINKSLKYKFLRYLIPM